MMMHTAHTTIQSSHTPASSAIGAAASGVRASTASNSSQYGPTDLTNFEEDAELSGAARRTPLVISHSQRTSFDLGADSHRTSFSTAHSPSSLAGSLPSPVGPAQAAARRPSSAYSTPERCLEGLSGPVFGAPLVHFSGLPAAIQPRPASQPTISATNPASRFAVLRRPTRHDPYAPLPERVPTPPARSTPPATIYHGISHQPLVHRCRYVAWPARLAATDSRAATPVVGVEHLPRLVIDQVKFEMSPAQLRWLIRELTGVVAVSVEEASRGCFVARFRNESDFELARKMNRAVLFDHNGAWCPAGPEESVAVAQYMATREFRQRGQRLPRELIVVSKSGPRRSPTFA